MNTPPNDSPELTAYALGELSAGQAREVHAMLAALPAALSELEQVEAITDALRQRAPIPQQRLTPEQRHAVLHPANLPRLVVPMQPRQMAKRRPAQLWPAVRALTQAAAVIAVTGVAFVLGRNMPLRQDSGAVAVTAPHAPEAVVGDPEVSAKIEMTSPRKVETTEVASAEPVAPPMPAPVQEQRVVAAQQPAPRAEVVTAPVKETPAKAVVVAEAPEKMNDHAAKAVAVVKAAPKSAPAGTPGSAAAAARVAMMSFTTPPESDAFVSTSRDANDQFALRPAQIRPAPVKADRATQFASPITVKPAGDAKGVKSKPNELFIHSWSADVTTCPWNEANRLMRVVVQLPADQPATASAENAYPIQVNFDPNTVREYRMLCERHQPASELRQAGTHVVWYEFQPNGTAAAARENGRHVATVTLPGARFTTQTMEPFDGSKLRVLDRGQAWEAARDDFVFESSVVGFGMLLRGAPQSGKLDHQLVLNLATKAKAEDEGAERAKFIRLVQEAKRAAGL